MPHSRPLREIPAVVLHGLLALGISGPLLAQGLPIAPKLTPDLPGTGEDTANDLPGLEMLVEGSILRHILIPQYNAEHRLTSTLQAKQLVLVDRNTIDATDARIEFYHPDETLRASIDLEDASLTNQSILRTDRKVVLSSDDFEATGQGLVYLVRSNRGILLGPAVGRFQTDRFSAMNLRPKALAAGTLMLVSAPLQGEPQPALDAEQIQGLDRLAVSNADDAEAAATQATADLEKAEADSAQADVSLDSFLRRAAVELPEGKTPDLTSEVPAPEKPPIKLPATVEADGGIYFDAEAGLLTFLKNVRFDHPQFSLQGAEEVKVFVDKKEKPAAEAGEDEKPKDGDLEFGDPTKIIATGAVVVERKKSATDTRSVKASGRQMVYDLTNGELIIRGGQPWVLSDSANGRIIDPNGYIRINLKSGDASFVGRSQAFVETDRPR